MNVALEASFRPVPQTRFGVPDGNCFSACVASLLGLSIDEVPEYQCDYADEAWWQKWVEWFAARGLSVELTYDIPHGLAIMNVNVPTPHSVVVRDGVVVWNPHHGEPLPARSDLMYFVTIGSRAD